MTLALTPLDPAASAGAWIVLAAFSLGALALRWAALARAQAALVPVRVRRRE